MKWPIRNKNRSEYQKILCVSVNFKITSIAFVFNMTWNEILWKICIKWYSAQNLNYIKYDFLNPYFPLHQNDSAAISVYNRKTEHNCHYVYIIFYLFIYTLYSCICNCIIRMRMYIAVSAFFGKRIMKNCIPLVIHHTVLCGSCQACHQISL